jgi:hypothetical protein
VSEEIYPITPATLFYAQIIYKRLREDAKPTNDYLLYTGKLSAIYDEAGMPPSQHGDVRTLLYNTTRLVDGTMTPCLILLKKGAGGQPSEVAVCREPTLDDYEQALKSGKLLTSAQRAARVVEEAEKRITDLESRAADIERALQDHESRMIRLEGDSKERDAKAT